MEDLVKAFQIFLKYNKDHHPTACEHDIIYVQVDPTVVSDEDKEELERLGFHADIEENDNFYSFRFGSC
jgi:hypothetical protein